MKLFAIKDVKPGKFLNIFFADNNFTAMRDVSGLVNGKQDTMFAKYPEDFQLFTLGEIDQATGMITPKVEFIENFTALVKVEHNEVYD